MNEIVVGVDGSPSSQHALRWAVAEASLRGVGVRVVHAWAFAYNEGEIARLAGQAIGPELEHAAISVLDRALEGIDTGGVALRRTISEGPPTRVLLEAAGDADLLVVGNRGHGGFAGLLLGSVSQQCAQYAPCPVVIVRHGQVHSTSAPPSD